MKDPGEYSLIWANRHIRPITWNELVEEIRAEAVAEYRQVPMPVVITFDDNGRGAAAPPA